MSPGAIAAVALMLMLCPAAQASAQQEWSFDYSVTFPYNAPLPLHLQQQGEPDIRLTARYASEPLVVPITWMWKISLWSDSTAWSLMAVHHKLYLENRPKEIEEFAISHGFNSISMVRSWRCEDFLFSTGAGIVLAHPENSVRGKRLPEDQGIFGTGYFVAGPTVNFAAGKRIFLVGGLFLLGEAMIHFSHASVPIADGTAFFFSLIGQLSIGVGFRF